MAPNENEQRTELMQKFFLFFSRVFVSIDWLIWDARIEFLRFNSPRFDLMNEEDTQRIHELAESVFGKSRIDVHKIHKMLILYLQNTYALPALYQGAMQ